MPDSDASERTGGVSTAPPPGASTSTSTATDDDGDPASSDDAVPEPPSSPRSGAATPDVAVIDGARAGDLARALEDALRRALAHVDAPVRRVHARLVRDDEMARLHERHLAVAGTTDVVTFPAGDGDGAVDVDLALCVDEAERQSSRRGHDPLRELLLYAVHGVLHEAGHDDHDDDAARRMHAEEDRILVAAGFGAVFGREGGS